MEEHKCPKKKANLSSQMHLNQQQIQPENTGIYTSAFPAASCFPCVLQKHLSCRILSWHLPWCQSKDSPCSLWPELGPSHRGKTLITSHSLCTKPALDFLCSLLEGREEELKCNAMRGIFRLMIDAPAVKGRWQSSEQLLGVSRMQVCTQVQMHLVSYSPLFFFFPDNTFLKHSIFF